MRNLITCCLFLLSIALLQGQKRLSAPKVKSNIESVDNFVSAAFEIYNVTFDYHYGIANEADLPSQSSLVKDEEAKDDDRGMEENEIFDESESKDEFKILDKNINILVERVPEILEEIDSYSVAKQVKATLCINRAIKALKHSGKIVKMTITGE